MNPPLGVVFLGMKNDIISSLERLKFKYSPKTISNFVFAVVSNKKICRYLYPLQLKSAAIKVMNKILSRFEFLISLCLKLN